MSIEEFLVLALGLGIEAAFLEWTPLYYCGAVFYRCGKGNEGGLECLQRRGGRIVLSTEQMVTSLCWNTLTRRRENHIVKLVEKCLKGTAPSYFSNYFQLKRHDIHDCDIKNKNKLTNKVKQSKQSLLTLEDSV